MEIICILNDLTYEAMMELIESYNEINLMLDSSTKQILSILIELYKEFGNKLVLGYKYNNMLPSIILELKTIEGIKMRNGSNPLEILPFIEELLVDIKKDRIKLTLNHDFAKIAIISEYCNKKRQVALT